MVPSTRSWVLLPHASEAALPGPPAPLPQSARPSFSSQPALHPRPSPPSPLCRSRATCDTDSIHCTATEGTTPAMKLDQVLTGDCLKRLAELPAECVDLAFADPPFNIGYEYDVYNDRQSRETY